MPYVFLTVTVLRSKLHADLDQPVVIYSEIGGGTTPPPVEVVSVTSTPVMGQTNQAGTVHDAITIRTDKISMLSTPCVTFLTSPFPLHCTPSLLPSSIFIYQCPPGIHHTSKTLLPMSTSCTRIGTKCLTVSSSPSLSVNIQQRQQHFHATRARTGSTTYLHVSCLQFKHDVMSNSFTSCPL